jgi:hypothetical protein
MGARLKRFLSAAALLPVLVFAFAGTTSASWLCRYDGVARVACCCPKVKGGHAEETQGGGPAFRSQGCCELRRVDVDKAPTDVSRGQPTVAPPEAAVASFEILPIAKPFAPTRARLQGAAERPPGGRVLLLQKQAFLI